MSATTHTGTSNTMLRWTVIVSIALVAFFASYRFAVASSASKVAGVPGAASTVAAAGGGGCCGGGTAKAATPAAAGAPAASAAPAAGGGCCGGGAKGPATTKGAAVNGSVQTIAVDVSKGYYDPSTIELKAGVPAEITFSQASGCTGIVQSSQLGFSEDLSSGPKTVKIAALQPGTYQFACGMNMVTGTIVVK